MTIDWYTLLSQAGYPAAYNHFPLASDTYAPPEPPFIVWLLPHEKHSGPDGQNMLSTDSIRVELYTSNKNAEAESKIETILSPWPFTKDETWIPDQKMYLISYDLSILRRI